MKTLRNERQELDAQFDPPISFSVYLARDGGPPTVRTWPTRVTSTFRALRESLSDPEIFEASLLRRRENGKYEKPETLGAYSPAIFRRRTDEEREAGVGVKDKSLVEAAAFLVFDLDAGEPGDAIGEGARIQLSNAGLLAYLHTSFNHTPGSAEAWRGGVATSRSVSASEYERLWEYVNTTYLGSNANRSTRTADRLYFASAHIEGADFVFHHIEGDPLDVDAILAVLPPPTFMSASTGARKAARNTDELPTAYDPFRPSAYAPTALTGDLLATAVGWFEDFCATTPPSLSDGYGDTCLWNASMEARLLQVPPERSTPIMLSVFNARCVPPWEPHIVERKVREAWNRGWTTPYAERRPYELNLRSSQKSGANSESNNNKEAEKQ